MSGLTEQTWRFAMVVNPDLIDTGNAVSASAIWELLESWLPVLGPTATLLLHRLACWREGDVDPVELAGQLGVKPTRLGMALERLEQYVPGFAIYRIGNGRHVAVKVPTRLPQRALRGHPHRGTGYGPPEPETAATFDECERAGVDGTSRSM